MLPGRVPPLIDEYEVTQRSAREAAAEAAFKPPPPAREREHRRVKVAATLAVLVLAVLGLASYEFVANAGHAHGAAAHPRGQTQTVRAGTAAASPTAAAPAPTAPATTAPATTAPATTAPANTAPATTPPPQVLTVASVAAFGPAGTTDGDNPQNVAQAVAGDPATPWYTDWYASPDFADLRPGTGLLLDMGRTVTVTSVRVSLGGEPGASLQLRAGHQPTLAWLPTVAGVSDAGGTVQLQPSAPVHVRYVLIWFTDLPPTPAGTYQASIYQVVIQGQP
jgi:hypothetical protein